tara:strand:+ start:6377 stop:7168 length:792 start_codon:yes stop_codon:yes gene_type:complete
MPTFLNKAFNTFYKRILQVNQSSNVGVDATTRSIQTGDGANTSVSLSDDQLTVKPNNDDTTTTFNVSSKGGTNILEVDTTNSLVKAGASQTNVLTLYKEMGLYEFSPGGGTDYHNPVIANNVGMQGAESITYDTIWGNGTDPATTLDLSAMTDPENAVAIYWILDSNITLDQITYSARCDNSSTINMHLFAYDLDTSSNHGDLSNGTVHANASCSATNTTLKKGTFTLDTANIDVNKVVIGFAQNETDTADYSVHFNIKYHIR